eukprot:Em0294g2a
MTNEGPALDSRALAQDLTKLDLEHFGSFKSCLRHSATKAADPAVTPASDKIEGFSGEVTVRSNAAGFPRNQLGTRTLLVWCCICHEHICRSGVAVISYVESLEGDCEGDNGVGYAVDSDVGNAVDSDVGNAVGNAVDSNAVDSDVGNDVGNDVDNVVDNVVDSDVDSDVDNVVDSDVDNVVDSDVDNVVD